MKNVLFFVSTGVVGILVWVFLGLTPLAVLALIALVFTHKFFNLPNAQKVFVTFLVLTVVSGFFQLYYPVPNRELRKELFALALGTVDPDNVGLAADSKLYSSAENLNEIRSEVLVDSARRVEEAVKSGKMSALDGLKTVRLLDSLNKTQTKEIKPLFASLIGNSIQQEADTVKISEKKLESELKVGEEKAIWLEKGVLSDTRILMKPGQRFQLFDDSLVVVYNRMELTNQLQKTIYNPNGGKQVVWQIGGEDYLIVEGTSDRPHFGKVKRLKDKSVEN